MYVAQGGRNMEYVTGEKEEDEEEKEEAGAGAVGCPVDDDEEEEDDEEVEGTNEEDIDDGIRNVLPLVNVTGAPYPFSEDDC